MQSLQRVSLTALLVLAASFAFAHPGEVDSKGCHRNSTSNQSHCHQQPRARSTASKPQHPPRAGDEGVFEGTVIWVTDADSLHVLVRGNDMEFRLADVDAPEHDQPYGWKAKLELIDLVRDRVVILVPRDTDRYGRTIARLWVGDLDVNRELVVRGAAWFYARYAEDPSLFDVEQKARDARAGLWALPLSDRIEPWVWRRRHDRAVAEKTVIK